MITLVKEPFFCALSKNSIEFHVQTNRYFTSVPLFPSLNISIDTQPVVGSMYSLKFTDPETSDVLTFNYTVVEFLSGSVQDNWNELVVNTATPSIANFRTELLKKLCSTPILNTNFSIEVSALNAVLLTAKEPIEDLILIWDDQQTGPYLETSSELKFNIPETRTGYELRANVFMEKTYGSGNWEKIASMPCVVGNDSISKIDLQSILDAEIESSFLEQPLPKSDFFINPYLYNYQVEFIESWTGESSIEAIWSKKLKVHWGGVSQDDEYMANPIHAINQNKSFLTWTPSGKRFSPGKSDFLAWMNTRKKGVFQLAVQVFTDLGMFTDEAYQIFELQDYETIVFNSGFITELESAAGSANVLKWNWRIKEFEGEWITEPFVYHSERNCLERTILLYNAFGIPEIHPLTQVEQSLNVNQQLASRSEKFGLSSYMPKNFVFDSASLSQYTAETSLLNQQEAKQFQTLMNATISYLIEDGRYVPVVLSGGTIAFYKNSEFLRFVGFSFQRANETDRISHFGQVPTLEPIFENNTWYIRLNEAGLNAFLHPTLDASFNGTGFGNFEWNPILNIYESDAGAFNNEGMYYVTGTIGLDTGESFYLSTKFYVELDKVKFKYSGNVSFKFQSYNAGDGIFINWGNADLIYYPINHITQTTINYTYAGGFDREGSINKLDLSDIQAFTCLQDLGNLNIYEMDKLKTLSLQNQAPRSYYFSGMPELTTISLNDSPIVEIEFGLLPKIEVIVIDQCSLSSERLDSIILELWKYRKQYNVVLSSGPFFSFQNLGFTPSDLFDSVVNGTGAYIGEGLATDYFCTVNFS